MWDSSPTRRLPRMALAGLIAVLALAFLALGLAGLRAWCFPAPLPGSTGLLAQRYEGARLRGDPQETYIERRVAMDSCCERDFAQDNFSLRLSGMVTVGWPGRYEIGLESDDDGRLFLDGRLLVDNSGEHSLIRRTGMVWLGPGRHLIEVEYANRSGGAGLRLLLSRAFGPAEPLRLESLRPPVREFSRALADAWGWRLKHLAAMLMAGTALAAGLALWAVCLPGSWATARARAGSALSGWRARSAAAALGRLWRAEPQGPDPARAKRRWGEAGAALMALGLALALAYPILNHLELWGKGDWDQHMFYLEVPRVTLLDYGQLPLWNPYYCGGSVMLANPQSRMCSPSYVLVLLLGTEAGIKLTIILNLALGLWGAWRLSRWWGLAIQKRSAEVWTLLEAVKTEFAKYGEVIAKVRDKLQQADKHLDKVSTRTRAIDRRLREVATLPDQEAQGLLGLEPGGQPLDEPEED